MMSMSLGWEAWVTIGVFAGLLVLALLVMIPLVPPLRRYMRIKKM